jgi:hypothetical protein
MLVHRNSQKALKLLTGILAIVLLIPTPVIAASKPPSSPPTYEQTIQSLYRLIDTDLKVQDPQKYRELSQVFHALFDSPVVKIPFRSVAKQGSQRWIGDSGAIYFAKGDIFIVYDVPDKASTKPSRQEESLATINGKLYSWSEGSQHGEILDRYPNDTLNFLLYRIDPGMIMRSLYYDYLLKDLKSVNISEQEGIKHLMFKQPQSSFAGILIRENPFWLSGVVIEDPKGTAGSWGWEIDPPIPLTTLPEK